MMSPEDYEFLMDGNRSYQDLRPLEDLGQAIPEQLDEFIEHNDFAPHDPNENDEEKMEFEQPVLPWYDIEIERILRDQEQLQREEDELWADFNRSIIEDGIIDPNNPPRQPLSPIREDDDEWNQLMGRFHEMVEIEENILREIDQFWRREEEDFNNVGSHSDTSTEVSFNDFGEDEEDLDMDSDNYPPSSNDEVRLL